jgi:type I restriction enzyme R subunit
MSRDPRYYWAHAGRWKFGPPFDDRDTGNVRKRLRSLVKFLERTKRPNSYTDFIDFMGEEREIDLPGFDSGHDAERFRDKTQPFLKAHANDPLIHKLRV